MALPTREIHALNARRALLANAFGDGHCLLGPDGVVELVNDEMAALYGVRREELTGKTWRELTDDIVGEDAVDEIWQILAKTGAWVGHTWLRRPHASPLRVEVSLRRTGSGAFSLWMRDASRDEKLRAQRRQMMFLATEAQERERRRTAEALHDQVGSMPYAVATALEGIASAAPNAEARQMAEGAASTARAAVLELSRIARGPHPIVLERHGLTAAVMDHVSQVARASAPQVFVEVEDADADVDAHIKLVAFRVVQEGIANALKHARATKVDVRIRRLDEQIVVTVGDDGVGLSDDRFAAGLGLVGLRGRAEGVGGSCEVSRGASGETILTVTLPRQAPRPVKGERWPASS